MKIKHYSGIVEQDLMDLLLLADPNTEAVKRYLQISELFVVSEGSEKIGVAVLTSENGEYELKNIAVLPTYQGRGIAKDLIAAIKNRAKDLGANSLLVGTGNSSLDQLALYQKCGFRIVSVKPDYFSQYDPAIYENGIRCQDLVVLKAKL